MSYDRDGWDGLGNPRLSDAQLTRHYIPTRKNRRNPYSSWHPGAAIGSILLLLGVLALILGYPVSGFITAHRNNSVQVITVTSKDDQATGSNGHQYLIFTPQGAFKDTDNIWLGKWDSSNVFNQLLTGHTYRCHVHGERQEVTSNYPDIISCTSAPALRATIRRS